MRGQGSRGSLWRGSALGEAGQAAYIGNSSNHGTTPRHGRSSCCMPRPRAPRRYLGTDDARLRHASPRTARVGDTGDGMGQLARKDQCRRPQRRGARDAAGEAGDGRESDTRESICLIVEAAARDANLPLEFFARVIWQESRFQADAVGADDAQRRARAGDRAVHAGHRERARAARSLRSGAGAAEIGRVLERAAQPVRQSRPRRCRLQCRPAAGAGMARRHRRHAGADPQLCLRHHRRDRRCMGQGRQHRQGAAELRRRRAAAN